MRAAPKVINPFLASRLSSRLRVFRVSHFLPVAYGRGRRSNRYNVPTLENMMDGMSIGAGAVGPDGYPEWDSPRTSPAG